MDSHSEPIRRIDNPGIKAEGALLHGLRKEVAQLLQRSHTGFPGAQPVSFARRHLEDLKAKDYYVCEKTDGIRYLLYLTEDENSFETCYLIDRKNDFWFIHQRNLHFPQEKDMQSFHTRTIIDGELVMDREPGGGERPSFLVFDCLILDGKPLMDRSLDKRLGYLKKEVNEPYRKLFKQYPEEAKYQAFQLVMKDMQFSYGMAKVFREVLPRLTHGNDGLIFTCRETAYKCGTDEHILKWKPVEDNTVDFKLALEFPTVDPDEQDRAEGWNEPYVDYESVPRATLLSFNQGEVPANADPYRVYAPLYLTEQEWETLKGLGDPLIGRIVECYMDEHGRWRMYRFRDDKPHANHISVVDKVIESIENPVTQEMLEEAGGEIRNRWKAREATRNV